MDGVPVLIVGVPCQNGNDAAVLIEDCPRFPAKETISTMLSSVREFEG